MNFWHRLANFFTDFFKKNPDHEAAQLDVSDAASKAAIGIGKVLVIMENPAVQGLEQYASEEFQASATQIHDILQEVKQDLEGVSTLTDVVEPLKDYKFAEDPRRNEMIHSFVAAVLTAFADENIDVFEVLTVGGIALKYKDVWQKG